MTHNGRTVDTRQSRQKRDSTRSSPERDRRSPEAETSTHPILDLQKSVGNRAVLRALGHQPPATHIQRHVAPGTVALGQMLSGSLLGHFADLSIQSQNLQQATSDVSLTADGLLGDTTDFIVYSVSAETYDTESTTQTTPSTVDVTEPLVIHGSDSQPAR